MAQNNFLVVYLKNNLYDISLEQLEFKYDAAVAFRSVQDLTLQ